MTATTTFEDVGASSAARAPDAHAAAPFASTSRTTETSIPILSIIVPTFKEACNVRTVVQRIGAALEGVDWEVIFVDDDSPDATAEAVRDLARRDHRVRCLQRIGRRGLSSACVEGMLSSSAPYLAVMDADLQHDERILSTMLGILRADEADIVVGSRYVEGGGTGNFAEGRATISRIATRLSRAVTKVPVADPMSGYFMLTSRLLHSTVQDLSATGFKILLDLLGSAPADVRVREVPYHFGDRLAGESKLDAKAIRDYLVMLLDKTVGRFVPTRFVVFSLIGLVGVAVHMAVLTTLFAWGETSFVWGQAWATFVAMSFNYALNNELTYRDLRLRGVAWLGGWASFVVACSIGAAANVGIAGFLFEHQEPWAVSAMAGILIGAVWNYAVTSIYTWHTR
ncbi:MAG: glycosyltransferase family 2 protein [Burkholderiaceae bacterium]